MDTLVNLKLQYDLEILRYISIQRQALKHAGLIKPSLKDRAITRLGEMLIHFGERIKEMPERKFTTEEASVPTFLIML